MAMDSLIDVRRGMSKGVKDGCMPPAHPPAPGVALRQGIEGSGMAGLGETLGSSWTVIQKNLILELYSINQIQFIVIYR
jgi:hypothetical protein